MPVLKAVVELYEVTGREKLRVTDIVKRVDLDAPTVQQALRALYAEPYLNGDGRTWASGNQYLFVGPATGDARRVVGAWPTPENVVDRLIAALESAAEEGDRPEDERSKLRKTAAWLGSAAYQVAIGALGGAGGNMLS